MEADKNGTTSAASLPAASATVATASTTTATTNATVTANSELPISATIGEIVEKTVPTEPTQSATVPDQSEETKKIDSLLNDLEDGDGGGDIDSGTSVTDSVAKEPETVAVSIVQETEATAVPSSATTAPVVADNESVKSTASVPIEAMDVEDSSSNDVEMKDLSQSDLKIEDDGKSQADTTTPLAVSPLKPETIPEVDEPDSKAAAAVKSPSTDSVAEKTTANVAATVPATIAATVAATIPATVVAAKSESKTSSLVDSTGKDSVIDHDEVEKNISNLFNGEESGAEITSSSLDKSGTVAKLPENNGQTVDSRSLNNGKTSNETGGKSVTVSVTKSKDECAKELVSILEDDKLPSKDSIESTKVENKVLNTLKNGSSTPNQASTTATAVFNSTPIQKQFDISSGNVSTISVATTEGNKSEVQIDLEPTSTDTSAISKSDVATDGSSSTDALTRYANVIRKYNGITNDQTDSINGNKSAVSSSITSTADEHSYEVNIWYNDNDLLCFSGERIDPAKINLTSDTSERVSSSIGSVNSLTEPFQLPTRVGSINSTASTDDGLPGGSVQHKPTTKVKQTITGTVELCKFVIEHFQKLGRSLTNDKSFSTGVVEHTPISGRRGGRASTATTSSATPMSTPLISLNKRKRGGDLVQTPHSNDDDDQKSTLAKKSKKDGAAIATPATPATPAAPATPLTGDVYPEKVVLARWIDKKYYAGRVIEKKPNHKFVVLFEDGAKKILPSDNIVFGNKNTLPLLNECVHALVTDDTYEPGIVRSVETKGETICYVVDCETITVTVTASDIYLEEDQAKLILAKQDTNVTDEPEPGFSGTVNTRKDRRQKRTGNRRGAHGFSESDVSDIMNESDSTPTSPKQTPIEAIVLVHGVQPELQITNDESKRDKLRFLIETFGPHFRSVSLDDILGPITESKIFRNKGFLLTCTIPIKSLDNNQQDKNHEYNLTNRTMSFTTVPFFKEHLQQQIEFAGGTVFNHFEDIPKNKHRTCVLLAPYPCLTAAYIQCLASNIPAISHEWLIKCCETQTLIKKDQYALPAGWSMIDNTYRLWSTGGDKQNKRKSNSPFNKITIIITSQQTDFAEFWTRVCRSAGAKIRTIKSKTDFTATLQGYILMDDEFPEEFRSMAERFNIPIVSTVWIVQSLIIGQVCDPGRHDCMTQLYEDENQQ